jgi:hypothetical protein
VKPDDEDRPRPPDDGRLIGLLDRGTTTSPLGFPMPAPIG